MRLPILLSVPHAGLEVPSEAKPFCVLTPRQIERDGDEGAAEIYDLADEVEAFVTTPIARAIVDVNRPADDRSPDGVVKQKTCWLESVYAGPLPETVVRQLLKRYYHPYHTKLAAVAESDLILAVDCHTMAASGPPIGPDPQSPRASVCLGDLNGGSLPEGWIEIIRHSFANTFGAEISINRPFAGGYITQKHHTEMPWVQLELSRAAFAGNADKRQAVLSALRQVCRKLGTVP